MNTNGYIIDLEADNLYLQSKKIWFIHLRSLDNKKELELYPFREGKEKCVEKFWEFHNSFGDKPLVVSFNGLGYDHWMVWKFFDISFHLGKKGSDWLGNKQVQFVDLFVMSQYLTPDRPKHSLESYGLELGNEKGDFSDWSKYCEDMRTYCIQDTNVTLSVYKSMMKKMETLYKKDYPNLPKSFLCMQKDYYLYSAQSFTGIKFDKKAAEKLVIEIEKEMQEIEEEVLPKLPPRSLKKTEQSYYTMPKKPFKVDGSLSSNMLRFIERHDLKVNPVNQVLFNGDWVDIESEKLLDVKLPMELKDGNDIKDWFIEQGWEPTLWNFKRDERGKPQRDSNGEIITTTPKIQEQGKICPNLLKIDGDLPKRIVHFLSLRNRKSVVTGWLNHWRLEFDGRLPAEITGYTPTTRVKHSCIVNLPKASPEVVKGYEIRSLFVVDDDLKYVSADAAALENRTVADYTYKYDDGSFADLVLNGDSHCFSEDTYILTKDGWKLFNEISKNSFVAQWDNGNISFVNPTDVIWRDYSGDMVCFKNRSIDMLLTPNHRVIYYDARKPEINRVKFADNFSKINGSLRVPLCGKVNSEGLPLSVDEILFCVAAQADSYYDGKSYRFEFVKKKKIDEIKRILNNLGVKYSETTGKGGKTTKVYVNKKNVDFVDGYLLDDKSFSNLWFGVTAKQGEIFIEALSKWDGTTTESGAIVFDTTCKKSRDISLNIGVLSGYRVKEASYKKYLSFCKKEYEIHRVYFSKSRGASIPKPEKISYTGKIGCVSVPSSFVVVKRNGKVFISGNSFNAKIFFPKQTEKFDPSSPDFNKDDPLFKPWRNKAKTGAYSLAYGASVKKFTKSLGLSEREGKKAYEDYWEANQGLKRFKEAIERYWESVGKKQYIISKDGQMLTARSKHLLVNLAGQSLGAKVIAYCACMMDNKLGWLEIDELGRPYYNYKGYRVARLAAFHDQLDFEAEPEVAEEVGQFVVDFIVKAGKQLNMKVELDGEYKVGNNAAEIH